MHLREEGHSHEVEDRIRLYLSCNRVGERRQARHVLRIHSNQDYLVSCDV